MQPSTHAAMRKKIKGIMTLVSLALAARILTSFVISRTTMAYTANEEEFHSLFAAAAKHPLHTMPEERSTEYCNEPGKKINGLEGIPPRPDMKLIGAAIMVRHGDRLPISRPPSLSKTSPIKTRPCGMDHLVYPTNPLLQSYMKSVQEYSSAIKSNLNSAMRDFDLLPDTCSDVSITQTGIVQMLELGQFVGERYLHKGSTNKDIAKNIAPTTSRFARTFQSLLPFLYGMSPSLFPDFVRSKISTSSSLYFCDSDLPTVPSSSHCDCPKAKRIAHLRAGFRHWDTKKPSIALLHKIWHISSDFRDSKSSEQEKKIGPTPLSIISPSRVWDWLVSDYYCPGRDLPCLSDATHHTTLCLNSSIVEDLVRLVDENHLKMIGDKAYMEAVSLAMYPFLNSVNTKFNQLVMEHSVKQEHRADEALIQQPFLWVLSGHDITLGPLSVALGMPLLKKAPYATRVVFELWKGCDGTDKCGDSSGSNAYIRILLNGKDVTSSMGRFQTRVEKNINSKHQSLYPLELFGRFVERDLLARFNFTEYDAACAM